MERAFESKVAIVTGGAKGIGKCICEECEYAQRVGVTAPFYLSARLCPPRLSGLPEVTDPYSSLFWGCH